MGPNGPEGLRIGFRRDPTMYITNGLDRLVVPVATRATTLSLPAIFD